MEAQVGLWVWENTDRGMRLFPLRRCTHWDLGVMSTLASLQPSAWYAYSVASMEITLEDEHSRTSSLTGTLVNATHPTSNPLCFLVRRMDLVNGFWAGGLKSKEPSFWMKSHRKMQDERYTEHKCIYIKTFYSDIYKALSQPVITAKYTGVPHSLNSGARSICIRMW